MSDEAPEQVQDQEEDIAQTAPIFPWEMVLKSASFFFQRLPGGGMQLKFAPSVASPQGQQVMPPGFTIEFGDEGWQSFKRSVERDGETSKIAIAKGMPNRVRPR